MDTGTRSYPRSHRLSGKREFTAVFDAKVRETRGFLCIYARANELKHPRLGMSISRKVGTAPRRNRMKRLIREAFRHMQHDLPVGYDLVVVVRPHEPASLAEYQRLLGALLLKLHHVWQAKCAGS